MGIEEVLVQKWQQEELFDWQMLVQRTRMGREGKMQKHGKRWGRDGSP